MSSHLEESTHIDYTQTQIREAVWFCLSLRKHHQQQQQQHCAQLLRFLLMHTHKHAQQQQHIHSEA